MLHYHFLSMSWIGHSNQHLFSNGCTLITVLTSDYEPYKLVWVYKPCLEWWVRMWQSSEVFWLYLASQKVHAYGLTPRWSRSCCFRVHSFANLCTSKPISLVFPGVMHKGQIYTKLRMNDGLKNLKIKKHPFKRCIQCTWLRLLNWSKQI